MILIELNLKELIKAYEIVKSENPAGGYQVQRGRVLNYLRKTLIDSFLVEILLLDESKK